MYFCFKHQSYSKIFEFLFVFNFKVAVVEVQRCWNRFLQIGGNKNGLIEKNVLEKSELNNGQDIITKNVKFNI